MGSSRLWTTDFVDVRKDPIIMDSAREVLVEGLRLPEAPRWHEGEMWFSDIFDRKVYRLDQSGQATVVCEVPNRPSGLGWDSQGHLLVVSQDARLLRYRNGRLEEVSDHGNIVHSVDGEVVTNDMVVDRAGRAFIGSFCLTDGVTTPLIRVDPSGESIVVAAGLRGPNGLVITPDGTTLIVADLPTSQLVAFTITEAGDLINQRVFADLASGPDGICLDVEGAIWVGCPFSRELLRIQEGGKILDHIDMGGRMALAPMLGGPGRKTLFIATLEEFAEDGIDPRTGRFEAVQVDVPGDGLP